MLALIAGLVIGLYSVTPVVDLGEPASPDLVDADPVTQEDVAQALQELFATGDHDQEYYEYAEDAGETDDLPTTTPDNDELDAAITSVAELFDAPSSYPWKDTSECARRGWRGSCNRWKKKRGARTVLLEAMMLRTALGDVESVELAKRLVLIAPTNDDGRFVYLGLYKDLLLATNGQPEPVVAAMEAAIGNDDWEGPARLELAVGLITAKTQDAGSAKVAALVAQTPRMRELFGTSGLKQAVLQSWEVTKDLPPQDATSSREVIFNAAAGVPGYQRPRVFDAWRVSNADAANAANATNNTRMASWRSEVAEYEQSLADAEANRTAAKATAVSGLGVGVAGICAVGVLLAVLGVERNTRRTEALLAALQAGTTPISLGESSVGHQEPNPEGGEGGEGDRVEATPTAPPNPDVGTSQL